MEEEGGDCCLPDGFKASFPPDLNFFHFSQLHLSRSMVQQHLSDPLSTVTPTRLSIYSDLRYWPVPDLLFPGSLLE